MDGAPYLMNAWYMAGWSDELDAPLGKAFTDEDKPIIEAAYANLDGKDFWDAKPAFLGVDAGGTRARRLLQKRIAQERTVL